MGERGYGFEIKKRGSGLGANQWPTIMELVYGTANEAEKAEQAFRDAIRGAVHAQGHFSPLGG
jgi:hypothetical protein